MSIHEIEAAIEQLPAEEVAKLAEWFAEFQARAWDEQIAEDIRSGRLNALIQEAEREIARGNTLPLRRP
jgi:hypothetical protein